MSLSIGQLNLPNLAVILFNKYYSEQLVVELWYCLC